MQGDNPSDGKQANQFSPDDAVVVVIVSAQSRFTSEIDEFRRLYNLSRQKGVASTIKSEELQQLARFLTPQQRKVGEEAASKYFDQILKKLGTTFTVEPTKDPPVGKHYPVAPEQLAAFYLLNSGLEPLKDGFVQLQALCDYNPDTIRYALEYLRWNNRDPNETQFGKLFLPSVVATFEQLLAALVRLWLTLYPDAMGGDSQNVKAKELLSYGSREEMERWAIDKRVDEFINQSPLIWLKQLSLNCKVYLNSISTNWDSVLEVFARRNAMVHNGGLVDQTYLDHLPKDFEKPAIGTPLTSDSKYLVESFELIRQLGVALSIAWAAHFTDKSPGTLGMAVDPVYRALRLQRWNDARTYAQLALANCELTDDAHILQVNRWMARQEMGEDKEEIEKEIETWKHPNDNELRYRLAKAALLFEVQECLNVLKEIQTSAPSLLNDVKTWPLIERMKSHSAYFARQLMLLSKSQQPKISIFRKQTKKGQIRRKR